MPEPRWSTPQTIGRDNRLPQFRALASLLGLELMPWQELVIAVGTEVGDDGLPAFREIDVLVPRQSGKTLIDLLWELDRALQWGSPQSIAYTAQTGQDARVKLIEDQLPMIERSPLKAAVAKSLKGAAMTYIKFRTGSRIDVVATAAESGHGRTYGLAVIDEAMADRDNRREGALVPTMNTIPDAQILVTSTAGTEESSFLRRKVENGRRLAEAGKNTGIAYFEWSAADDADPTDENTWWECMPALGHTITPATIQHAYESLDESEFRRAYLNQWVAGNEELVIPAIAWEAVCDSAAQVGQPAAFAVDATPERDWCSVAVSDGRSVEVAAHRSGVGWAVDWLVERAGVWRVPVAVESNGPAGSLVDTLEARGVSVVKFSPSDTARAATGFHDRVVDGSVVVRREAVLDVALGGARRRPVSQSWAFGRRDTTVVVSPLVAASLAVAAAGKPAGKGPASVVSLADL